MSAKSPIAMVPRTKSMVATALGTWYIVLIMACFKYSAGIWVFALVAIMSLSRGAPEQFASQSKPSEIDADFSNQGPCSIKTIKAKFVLPPGVDGLGKSLPITATLPSCGRNLQALRPPYPVVFFYNGFQVFSRFLVFVFQFSSLIVHASQFLDGHMLITPAGSCFLVRPCRSQNCTMGLCCGTI